MREKLCRLPGSVTPDRMAENGSSFSGERVAHGGFGSSDGLPDPCGSAVVLYVEKGPEERYEDHTATNEDQQRRRL